MLAAEPLLADTDDLKTALKAEYGVEVTMSELLLAVRRAGARFRGETQNKIHRVTDDVILLDGTGTNRLLLPAAPVIGPVVVKLYDVDVSGEVRVSRRNGILKLLDGLWPDDFENVEVTYSHGYDPIPNDVQDAVLEHAVTLALTHAHVAQEGAGGIQATYGPAAMVGRTQKWADTVARYTLKNRL